MMAAVLSMNMLIGVLVGLLIGWLYHTARG